MKKILKILGVIFLLLILGAALIAVTLVRDPGLYLRVISERLREGKVYEASYIYNSEDSSKNKSIPFFYFIPPESGYYNFVATDLKTSNEVFMTMSVADKYLVDYFLTDNHDLDTGKLTDTFTGSAMLQESKVCYVFFTVEPTEEDPDDFSGSFKVSVTKGSGDDGPPVLTEDEPVTLKVDAEGQACAVFTPPETGYYKFEHSIVSSDVSKGYSSLSSITAKNNVAIGLTNGISMLQKGKEYYVWATVNETGRQSSEIELSCRPLKTEKADGICYVDLTGESVIEYVAGKDCNLAIYTVSSGDPKLMIYEKAGFPLRSDDRSEQPLSDNPEDVATVLRVKHGTGLHICIFDDVKDCRVYITEYKGDGTSLTKDDILPVPEKKSDQTEQTEQTEKQDGSDDSPETEEPEESGQPDQES